MSDFGVFGDSSRYYAARSLGPGATRLTIAEKALRDRLGGDAKRRVERVCKEMGQIIRACLRAETALRLSQSKDKQEVVSVQVVDGIPYPVLKLMEEVKDPAVWEFILKRRLLSETKGGLALLHEHFDEALHVLGEAAGRTSREHISSAHDFVSRLLSSLPAVNIVMQILGQEEDVLGAYFYRQGRIEVYWVVLGLAAAFTGVDIGDLTAVVLAHELAHAYTHLGFDIVSAQWNTEKFAHTDSRTIEGLAQFYTQAVCERLSARNPAYLLAYQLLLKSQVGPYRVHTEWASEDENAGETVRVAMVAVRSKGLQTYDEFLEVLSKGPIRPKKKSEVRTDSKEPPDGLFE